MKIVLSAACLLLSTVALAQTPAETATAKPPVAKHSCVQPPMPDANVKLAIADANAFVKLLEIYRNCVQEFTEGQKQIVTVKQKEAEALRTQALEASAVAAAAATAANAAAKDYNDYSEKAVKIVTPKDPTQAKAAVESPALKPAKSY